MTEKKAGREAVSERLHEAIEGLRKDATRVEIWATALSHSRSPSPIIGWTQNSNSDNRSIPVGWPKITAQEPLKVREKNRLNRALRRALFLPSNRLEIL